MIARAFPLFVLLILLPDSYLYLRYMRRRSVAWWWKVLWWMVTAVLLFFTCWLALSRDFTPQPYTPLLIYLFIMGVFIVPKALYALCLWVGRVLTRRRHPRRNWGSFAGGVLALMSVYVTIYGSFRGFERLEVNRSDCYAEGLPESYEGYRVAVFSDIHLGSYSGIHKRVIHDMVDSINALHPDVVLFLGDIQNTRPEEIEPHILELSRLSAPDGVYSILGNHDYSKYMGGTRMEKMAAEKKTRDYQARMGWRLLRNEHVVLRHGSDSLVIAGVEGNEEWNTDHGYSHPEIALRGVDERSFTIMLVHNPKRWRMDVLPMTKAQLTVSGHTHGGQVSLLGLSPTVIVYPEDAGWYEQDGRQLYVTKGVGALIPLRFNVNSEVSLITLHQKKKP